MRLIFIRQRFLLRQRRRANAIRRGRDHALLISGVWLWVAIFLSLLILVVSFPVISQGQSESFWWSCLSWIILLAELPLLIGISTCEFPAVSSQSVFKRQPRFPSGYTGSPTSRR